MKNTPLIMPEYRFSLTGNLPYKDRIYDSVLIQENTEQGKNYILAYFTQWEGKARTWKIKTSIFVERDETSLT